MSPRISTAILLLALVLEGACTVVTAAPAPPLLPSVEIEEPVYTPAPANNGSGPMWCYGSTCLVRNGQDVFASGLEVLKDEPPLNNTRWLLFKREAKGWQLQQADPTGRQREPCMIGLFNDGRILLSTNPTLNPPKKEGGGPAQPQVLIFDSKQPRRTPTITTPTWTGNPALCEHSYRGLAVDPRNHEALLLQNTGYDAGYWSFFGREGKWLHSGVIKMPWGAEFEKPEPIRICYQNMALRDRSAHILGVSDIIEWVREWREYKLILHEGKHWDYDFRRLYYCWTPDVTKQPFSDWVKVADCDKTCGHITNLDLWLDPQGHAHLLWVEQSVWDTRVRDKFFPDEPQTYALMYGIVDQGKVVKKIRLGFGGEKQESKEIFGYARFQVTPDNRLFVFYYCGGSDAQGKALNENRLLEIRPNGTINGPVRVELEYPFTSFMTATTRGGSAPSATLDLLGYAAGAEGIRYARINLLAPVRASFDYSIKPTADGSEISLDASGSQAVGTIASYSWRIGDKPASGMTLKHKALHGGPLPVTLTVKDAQGHTNRCSRTVQLPCAPSDFGLQQWGLALRVDAESFAEEGGGVIRRRADKMGSHGMSISHWDTLDHWLQWQVDVPVADRYYLLARHAVPLDAARVLSVDDQVIGSFAFPSTGGYGSEISDNWGQAVLRDAKGKPLALTLSAGPHRLRLHNKDAHGLNLDYLELIAATQPAGAWPGFSSREDKSYRYLLPLKGTVPNSQLAPELKLAYTFNLGPLFPSDGNAGMASTLRLFEDGKELGPGHAGHVDIRDKGQGRYSHWRGVLYLSASDNSDPRTNGRKYTWELKGE